MDTDNAMHFTRFSCHLVRFAITVTLTGCTCEIQHRGTAALSTGVARVCRPHCRRARYLLEVRRWPYNNNKNNHTGMFKRVWRNRSGRFILRIVCQRFTVNVHSLFQARKETTGTNSNAIVHAFEVRVCIACITLSLDCFKTQVFCALTHQ